MERRIFDQEDQRVHHPNNELRLSASKTINLFAQFRKSLDPLTLTNHLSGYCLKHWQRTAQVNRHPKVWCFSGHFMKLYYKHEIEALTGPQSQRAGGNETAPRLNR